MSGTSAIQAGDRVAFLDEAGGGVVLRLVGRGRAVVRTDEGFELVQPVEALVRREQEKDRALARVSDHHAHLVASNDRLEEKRAADRKQPGSSRKAAKGTAGDDPHVMEIDLHLHEIVEDERGLNDGEKLRFQLDYFERMLNTAIRERKRRLIVIHGVGEGVLREEVRKVLEYYEGVRFDDADPRRYGYGATAVEILHHGHKVH
ncbi:MAG: Smr/MutS family protein [Flavobacteriales bacterium]|nr:Smr/MutS family protein [Flavobacteriales bacterium]